MSPIVTSVDEIDLEISVAYIALGSARGRFDRCPSGENQRRMDRGPREIDRLGHPRHLLRQLAHAPGVR
jgi:hypothetical protein